MTITPFGQGAAPGRDQERPLADRLVQVLDAVLDHAPEPPAVKSEALAAAALHVFGMSRHGGTWAGDAKVLAELVKAIGFVCDKGIGGPCAVPPGTILGMKPASLREARPLLVASDRAPDGVVAANVEPLFPAKAVPATNAKLHQPYDETNGWGG